MTKFFGVVSVSATHIYHSALEISPLSSIVRRLYHHQRITPASRLVVGTPSSWKQSISIPNQDDPYRSCAWSPCGRFIAARTHEVVEVRDPLTSELLSSLKPSKHTLRLTGPLAYSSDGRSLCCVSNTGIIIWDIQTGGMVREVGFDDTLDSSRSLVWSLDGRMIGAVLGRGHTWAVVTYDVASGRILSRSKLGSVGEPYLWAHDKSFRVMAASLDRELKRCSINVFEVWPTLSQVKSFPISLERWAWWSICVKSFSPISHRVSISVIGEDERLLILDVLKPVELLLNNYGSSDLHSFSSDGNLFAASLQEGVHIWRYIHSSNPSYTPWREFPDPGWSPGSICPRFSPTSSSILGHFGGVLQVWYLDDNSFTRAANGEPYILFAPHFAYIITAFLRGGIVNITNHISRTPPQLIDTGTTILGFALTGNVLLVAGPNIIMAWRLTDGGSVDGIFCGRGAGPGDSIWSISPEWRFTPPYPLEPSAMNQAGSIALDGILIYIYHAGTEEEFEHIPKPLQFPDVWYTLKVKSRGQYYLRCRELGRCEDPSGDTGRLRTAFQEGWLKDPEGKHRLWLPVEWRTADGCAKLFYYLATLQLEFPGDLNAAMF